MGGGPVSKGASTAASAGKEPPEPEEPPEEKLPPAPLAPPWEDPPLEEPPLEEPPLPPEADDPPDPEAPPLSDEPPLLDEPPMPDVPPLADVPPTLVAPPVSVLGARVDARAHEPAPDESASTMPAKSSHSRISERAEACLGCMPASGMARERKMSGPRTAVIQ